MVNDLGKPLAVIGEEQSRPRKRDQLTVWIFATLGMSLFPYAALLLFYRNIEDQRRWLSFYELFGKGDLALVIISVVGATAGEVAVAQRIPPIWRIIGSLPGILIALLAIVVFTTAQYQLLAGRQPDSYLNAVLLTSMLAIVVLVHLVIIIVEGKR